MVKKSTFKNIYQFFIRYLLEIMFHILRMDIQKTYFEIFSLKII